MNDFESAGLYIRVISESFTKITITSLFLGIQVSDIYIECNTFLPIVSI